MKIGIDFDNTIINYSKSFTGQAHRFGWVESNQVKTKHQIRNSVRRLLNGEKKWMKLQGLVYGEFINDAHPFEGVLEFIKRCATENIEVFVVSHKTEYVEAVESKINLRGSALSWLDSKGFLDSKQTGLTKRRIFFEHPMADKIERVKNLGCTHFIDDLQEVLLDAKFPEGVKKILFTQETKQQEKDSLLVFSTWKEIEEEIFEGAHTI